MPGGDVEGLDFYIDRLNGITDVTETYVISAATVFLFFFSVHRFAVIQH